LPPCFMGKNVPRLPTFLSYSPQKGFRKLSECYKSGMCATSTQDGVG
jgi:hypothetical protein